MDFSLDMFEHYQEYFIHMNPNANGPYSYSIFKSEVAYRLDLVHYLTKNYATFLVYEFACFIAIIVISFLSMDVKNRIDRFFNTYNS